MLGDYEMVDRWCKIIGGAALSSDIISGGHIIHDGGANVAFASKSAQIVMNPAMARSAHLDRLVQAALNGGLAK